MPKTLKFSEKHLQILKLRIYSPANKIQTRKKCCRHNNQLETQYIDENYQIACDAEQQGEPNTSNKTSSP